MPQGSRAAPGGLVKIINMVIKGLERVAAYLDDVIVYDRGPTAHTNNTRVLFKRLQKYNVKLFPAYAKIGATKADFLGHTISPAGTSPKADKVAALTKMSMPTNVKQTHALIGGIGYYRKFLENLSTRLRPITALLKYGAKFVFNPGHESYSPPTPPDAWYDRGTVPLFGKIFLTDGAQLRNHLTIVSLEFYSTIVCSRCFYIFLL